MRILLIFAICLCTGAHLPAQIEPSETSETQSQPNLLLYYSPYCPYSHTVLTYLKSIHKKVPLRNVLEDKNAKDDLLKFGGKAQVPCLIIDGKAMYEAEAIVQWLSEHQSVLENN